MEPYLYTKSIFMALALLGAFGWFFHKIYWLYRVMMSVHGEIPKELNQFGARVKVLFTDVLGQRNVLRKIGPGLAHLFIFFGFILIQPHSLELMVKGVFPFFGFEHLFPTLYSCYLFIAEYLGLLIFVGFAYVLYRRTVIRPPYLTMGRDANLIILFTVSIVATFYLINAVSSVTHDWRSTFAFNPLPVSSTFAALVNLSSLSPLHLFVAHEIFYYLHIGIILGFLIYIPGSKHLHLLAAAPNVFCKRLTTEKAMRKTNLEDENAESFGIANISEINWFNTLNLYACTECGRCQELCPADNTGKPLSPKKLIHDLKVDLLNQANTILKNKKEGEQSEEIQPLLRENSSITEDVLWSCTTCRSCESICPVNIEHLDFILEIRKNRVLMESLFPAELQETFLNLEKQGNPWGFAADSRANWAKDLDIPLMSDKPDSKILYYVGCAGAFDDRGMKISRAIARILKKAEVDFAILGPEEMCNGEIARRAGNEYLGQMLIMQNVETINQYQPELIVTGCPHCFNTLKNEYPEFGANFPVVHYAEYFKTLINEQRLTITKKDYGSITFHDSCYLGRWNDIYQPPRELLQAINTGSLLEMPRNGAKSMCCGAGGGRMFMEETIGERINNVRASQAIETGAELIASTCPFCATMLNDGVLDNGGKQQVKDLAELLDAATD